MLGALAPPGARPLTRARRDRDEESGTPVPAMRRGPSPSVQPAGMRRGYQTEPDYRGGGGGGGGGRRGVLEDTWSPESANWSNKKQSCSDGCRRCEANRLWRAP